MALPSFINPSRRKLDQIVAIDLGSRFTKAVLIQRRSDGFALCGHTVMDGPIFEKALSRDLLKEHLIAVNTALGSKVKHVALTIGVNDAIVRQVDMPIMPEDDLRMILKNNSRAHLQQELTGYTFDFHRFKNPITHKSDDSTKSGGKQKMLIVGAKTELIDDYVAATKAAGLIADHIVPSAIAPANAFQNALPELCADEVVALVDIGFTSSSILIVREGEPLLSRVVGMGGDRLTHDLAEAMSISYAEAEGIKIGIPAEVQTILEALLIPLGRELRASMDFFEHQQDRTISRVLVSGGCARSEYVLQVLGQELAAECSAWDPTRSMRQTLAPGPIAELDQLAPQLTVAIGTALTAL